MKKVLLSIVAILTLSTSVYAVDGYIFARTLRGETEIAAQNAKLKTGDVAIAKGAQISVKEGGFASFALSNYSSCIVLSGKVSIAKFEQDEVQTARLPLHSEMSTSNIEIEIDEGEAIFARGEFRPASSFKIKTKFGVIEPVGNNIKVKVENSKLTVLAYDAAIRYSKPNSQEKEYIPIGYELTCVLENGVVSSSKKRSSITQKASLKTISNSTIEVFKTTEFYKDKNGKICARRIVFKDFFIRTTEPIGL